VPSAASSISAKLLASARDWVWNWPCATGAGADQQGQRAELPSQIRVARRRQKADQP